MSTYSQYDISSNLVSNDTGGNVTTWICNGIQSNAVRYSAGTFGGAAWNIAFNTSTFSVLGSVHKWRDDGGGFPAYFSHSVNGPWSLEVDDAPTIYMATSSTGGGERWFTSPQWQYSSANPANSAGGGNTGGSGSGPAPVYGDGSIDIDSNGSLTYYISSDAPTAQYDIFQDNTLLLSISHVTGTSDSGGSPGPFDRRTSEFSLKSGSTLIWYLGRISKVFCNFW